MIEFHTVENSRLMWSKNDNTLVIIYKGNFDEISKQIEYAILLILLNDIMPILEETDIILHICVDSDFETNQTLVCIPIVSHIFVDLKHISKNIWKNLCKHILVTIIEFFFLIDNIF